MNTTKHYKDGRRVSIKMDYLELSQFQDGLKDWLKFSEDMEERYKNEGFNVWTNYKNETRQKIEEVEELLNWIQK